MEVPNQQQKGGVWRTGLDERVEPSGHGVEYAEQSSRGGGGDTGHRQVARR
jgi:hypothetical protein